MFVFYGCETWTINEEDRKKLGGLRNVGMEIYRKYNLDRADHQCRSTELRGRRENYDGRKTIEMRQRNWVGRILRGNSLFEI